MLVYFKLYCGKFKNVSYYVILQYNAFFINFLGLTIPVTDHGSP
jgi:hypothetical protein